MEPILQAENLTVTYHTGGRPPYTALKKVSFSMSEGETVGIVGESGSGKSTLAKAVSRLIDPAEGRITLLGGDITHARGSALRQVYCSVQMVFQDPAGSFDPRKTLGYGIGESLQNAGLPKAEIQRQVSALLEQCGLPEELANRYPHQVSGGECQRAAIARALAIGPRILICDEATSALDVTVQQQIMALLQNLRRERELSILFICHNLALVQSFCDKVLVMKDGCIVEQGSPEQVICHPQTDYTRHLLDAVL